MPSCFARLVTLVRHARARNLILGSGILIALLVAAATYWVVTDLRADQIGHEKHELRNLSIALAEQIDRSLQGVDFLQHNLVDRTRELGVTEPFRDIACCSRPCRGARALAQRPGTAQP